MIINQKSLWEIHPLSPMERYKKTFIDPKGRKTSYGLTEVGYDIRLAQDVWLFPGRRFVLASTMERFKLPKHVRGRVENKSTLARMGLDASRTTNLEPGWEGWLTLELEYAKWKPLKLYKGMGIATVVFEELKHPAQYIGKYQNQARGPVKAVL